ncbi:hypothetical protein ACFWBB_20205 [Streptomyces sp. NPDC060000]|uniref:hypothetical protein n=1 Tax=Streptomyces sp. NPDC060000 TaxID=3347031 RepID=UPI00369A33CC
MAGADAAFGGALLEAAADDRAQQWPLSWLRGTYFPLAVVDAVARTAQGLVMGGSTRVAVELTEDQAEAAGLPPGHGYQVSGMLPRVTTLTVPIRRLRSVETPVSTSHHDAAFRGFH